jgi:hypothetical protein
MDKFFSRDTVEILVPIGLLLAGYMMKGAKGSFSEDNYGQDGGLW